MNSTFFGDDIRSRLNTRVQNFIKEGERSEPVFDSYRPSSYDLYAPAAEPPLQQPREQIFLRMNQDDPYKVFEPSATENDVFVCGDTNIIYNKTVEGTPRVAACPVGGGGYAAAPSLEITPMPTNPIMAGSSGRSYPIGDSFGDVQTRGGGAGVGGEITNYSKPFEDIPVSTYSPDFVSTSTTMPFYASITPGFTQAVTTTPTPTTTLTTRTATTTPYGGGGRNTTTPIIMNTPGVGTTTRPGAATTTPFAPWVATTTPSVSSYSVNTPTVYASGGGAVGAGVGATTAPSGGGATGSVISKEDVAVAATAAAAAANAPVPQVFDSPYYSKVASTASNAAMKTGDKKIEITVPKDAKLGMYASIGRGNAREVKRIVGFGSLILNSGLENDYPEKTTVEIYSAKPGTDAAKDDAKIAAALQKYEAISAPGAADSVAKTGPVDCKITGWDKWTTCGADGQRTRSQLSIGPQNGGATCPPLNTESESCDPSGGGGGSSSGAACTPTGWSDWTPCKTGSSTRTRVQLMKGTGCKPQIETDDSTCDPGCKYNDWGPWTACDATGKRTRTKTAVGTGCKTQTETDTSSCPINSTVTGWGPWSQCVAGNPSRKRMEVTVPPKNGGWKIQPKTETDNSSCPVACSFQLDTDPRSPYYACDPATATRVYTLTSFSPAINNGAPCTYEGVTIDSSSQLVLSNDKCPVDSTITGWTDWTTCDAGSSLRTRTQITRPPINNGNTIRPITQTDNKTCPVDCTFTLDFSNNVVCDQATGKNRYKVKTFNAKVNGGADCSYNGTIITQLNQVVASNIDCSVNCIASYTDGNDKCDASFNYVRTYNVSKVSINSGNICAFSDNSYNVLIRDVSAAGNYNAAVDTCADCSFALTQVGCDFATARKMFKVSSYTPAVRKGAVCKYTDGTVITGVNQTFRDVAGVVQPYFVSGTLTDKCPVDCSYTSASIVPCSDTSSCPLVTYKLANYVAAKNTDLGSKCRYNGQDISVNMVGASAQVATYQTNIGEALNVAILKDANLKYRFRFLTTDVTGNNVANWASGVSSTTGVATAMNNPTNLPLTQTGAYRAIFTGDNAASTSKLCFTVDPANTTFQLNNGFTVAFWFYPLPNSTQGDWLFNINTISPTDGLVNRSGLSNFSIDNSRLQVIDQYNNTTPFYIPIRSWSHIAYVVNSSTGQIRIYLNGFLITSSSISIVTANPLRNASLYIGHTNSMQDGYFQEFLFYTRPLTDVEVKNVVSFT